MRRRRDLESEWDMARDRVLTLDERVVEDEEHGRDVVRELRAAEEHLANVADVADLGVLETEPP